MTTTLTAQQLHELVNGEYVMPDGSKRRGLWERVPELIPRFLWEYEEGGTLTSGYFARKPRPEMLRWAREQGLESNATLIRVAVEDWLDGVMYTRGQQPDNLDDSLEWGLHWLVKCKDGYSAGISVSEMYERDRITMETTAPDRMTCLVAFAHAVADALGVPR